MHYSYQNTDMAFRALWHSTCYDRKLTRPRDYNTFLCSTQLSMKFIEIINVKIPTIVGILTFISMINTSSYESFKAKIAIFFSV